ncbi:MAG: hypothetical protein FJ184_00755 [Gammaproteobacteria bacterium]|nr:hypothetical protein [Gammaproteobacteria bacterium]
MLVVSSALMPFVPGLDAGTGVFLLFLALFVSNALLSERAVFIPRYGFGRWRGLGIIALLGLSIGSLVWLLANGGSVSHWLRAIAPFCFFILYLFLPTLTYVEAQKLGRALLLATALWALKVIVEVYMAYQSFGITVFFGRLTFAVADSVLVFPLVAIPLLLFWKNSATVVIKVALLVFFVALYLWIGYRGGLLIVAACFLAYVFFAKGFGRWVTLLILVAIPVIMVNWSGMDLLGQLIDRYASLVSEETDGVRAGELVYAWNSGAESPIVGKGLGWQVPFDVAFKGVDIAQLGDQADRNSVGYIHSLPAYFFMNLGIIGVALAAVCYVPWGMPLRQLPRFQLEAASAVGALAVALFSMSQASFRNIQAILLVVALTKIVDSKYGETALFQRAH